MNVRAAFLCAALLGLLVPTGALSQPQLTVTGERGDARARLDDLFSDLDRSAIPTGILYSPILSFVEAAAYDGTAAAPPATAQVWRQLYVQLERSFLEATTLPSPDAVRATARQRGDDGTIPLGVLYFRYQAVTRSALEQGLLRLEDGVVRDVPGRTASPYVERTAFAAAALDDAVYAGQPTAFRLDRDLYLSNQGAPQYITVDFGDGAGPRPLVFGEAVTVRYAAPGQKQATVSAHYADGTVLQAAFTVEVQRGGRQPDFFWENQVADLAYAGDVAGYNAYVFLGDGHTEISKPILFAEGFDMLNDIEWQDILEIISEEGLADDLLANGFDLIILDFDDATTYIQRNAFALVHLIERVIAERVGTEPLVVSGGSMGGLVWRYALAWMEANGRDHETRLAVSFDSPHQGANIPLGDQFWVEFFAAHNDDAVRFLEGMDSPAAQQQLYYHHTSIPDPSLNGLRQTLFAELAALGNYPAIRKVAIANGSGSGPDAAQISDAGVPMAPGDQILEWEHTEILVIDVTGNIWAVPDVTPETRIFEGDITVFFLFGDHLEVSASRTLPYDNAPGGWRDSQTELSAVEPSLDILGITFDLGDIQTDFPRHSFVPTISALDLRDGIGKPLDLFYDMEGDPDLLGKSPFDAVFFAPTSVNEDHIFVTPENAAFFLDQVLLGEVTVDLTTDEPVVLPPAGGTFTFTVTLTNTTPQAQTVEAWSEATGPVSRSPLIGPRTVTLPPGGAVTKTLTQTVPRAAPAGTYTYTVSVGDTFGAARASASFPVEKESDVIGSPRPAPDLAARWKARGWDDTAAPATGRGLAPASTVLETVYPNPLRGTTTIGFSVPESRDVRLAVYDVLGREVAVLRDGMVAAGSHTVVFDGSALPSGVYVLRMDTEAFVTTQRLTLLR